MTELEFLKSKGLIKEGFTEFIISGDFGKVELTELLKEYKTEQLRIGGIVKSLPIQDLPNCTRVEVIDQKGRSYVNWKPTNKVRLSMQDEGRTAKIFID